MYRKCVTDISVQHQKQIEAALLRLMQKQAYEEITVTAICAEAKLTRRIFYHLFGSKQDTLWALVDHAILGIESFRQEMSDQTLRFFLYWLEHKDLLEGLRRNQLGDLLLERMIDNVLTEDYDVLRFLQAEDPENRQDIIVFSLSGIWGLLFSWSHSGYRKTPEEMAALIEQLMYHPAR